MFPTVFKSCEKRCRCFHSKELLRWRLLSFNSVSNRARNFKSISRSALVPFWNYSPDYTLNCTPLDPITITMKNHQNVPNWWGTYSLNLLFNVPMKLKTVNCCHKVSPLLQLHCEVLESAFEARIMWAAAVANMNDFCEILEVMMSYIPEMPHIRLTFSRNSEELPLVQVWGAVCEENTRVPEILKSRKDRKIS